MGRALSDAPSAAVLAAGHRLVATARRREQLRDLVEMYGDQVRAVALDVTDEAAAERGVRMVVDEFRQLDVLANWGARVAV